MVTRRDVLSTLATVAGGLAIVNEQAQAMEDAAHDAAAPTAAPHHEHGHPYTPVRTLNGWTLPYTVKNGVKEFHLVAEEVEHEFAPGCKAKCWGYNGTTPGPTLEAVEGERVRILVTNRLGEPTSVH